MALFHPDKMVGQTLRETVEAEAVFAVLVEAKERLDSRGMF